MANVSWLQRAIQNGLEKRDAHRAEVRAQQEGISATQLKERDEGQKRLAPYAQEVEQMFKTVREELQKAGILFKVETYVEFSELDIYNTDLFPQLQYSRKKVTKHSEDSRRDYVAYFARGYKWKFHTLTREGDLKLFLGTNNLPIFVFSSSCAGGITSEPGKLENMLGVFVVKAVEES